MTTKVKGQHGPIDVSEASRQWHLKLPRGSCYVQLACVVIQTMQEWDASMASVFWPVLEQMPHLLSSDGC